MDNGYSLADVAAATGNSGIGGLGSEGLWVFALLILLFGGNGAFGRGTTDANLLTQADLQRAIDLNSIQNGQRDIEARVQEVGSEITSAVKDSSYNNLSEIRDVQQGMTTGFSAMEKCCCDQLRAIDSVNYNGALNTASINANTTVQTQKILDAIAQNKIEGLQARINELELRNAMSGVPRINPYGYGIVPMFPPLNQSGCSTTTAI